MDDLSKVSDKEMDIAMKVVNIIRVNPGKNTVDLANLIAGATPLTFAQALDAVNQINAKGNANARIAG